MIRLQTTFILFPPRCNLEARRIQSLGWLSEDDIQAASATSVIAVPGAAILALLKDSIRKNRGAIQ